MQVRSKIELSSQNRFDILALLASLTLALAFRLPGLTVFLTADEARSWFGRSIIFLDSLLRTDWANTGPGGAVSYIENVSLSPAPGVTTMWTGAIGIILEYVRQGMPGSLYQFLIDIPFDPLDPAMLVSLRLPGVLIAAAAVGLTFWWSRLLLGRWGALLAAAFIALDPFYLALSRVLGHDGLVATFMWLSLLAFLRGMNRRMKEGPGQPAAVNGWIVLSGALAGFAFLSKYPALFIGAFVALIMLILYLHRLWPTRLVTAPAGPAGPAAKLMATFALWGRDILFWSLAAGGVFVLFWPAMWVNPLGPVTTIVGDALRASGGSHQKGSFFLGQPVADPGLLFYPVVALLRTTPVIFFGFLLSLWLLVRGKLKRPGQANNPRPGRSQAESGSPELSGGGEKQHIAAWVLLAYVILYTLLVTYGGKKQDRYLLPAFPAMMMLAATGLYMLRFRFRSAYLSWLLPVALIGLQLWLVLSYYPYYFSYYNPFAGGGRRAANLIQVGWGEGLNEAAAYLNTLPQVESTEVTAWYSTTFEPYFKGRAIYKLEDEKISRSAKPGLAADYVVFYVNQVQRRLPSEGALQFFQAASPVYTVTLQGIDYAWVYSSLGLEHLFAGEVRLVGQAELLGFDLTDEAGRPIETLYPESVGYLSLYWEWQGKAEDEPIQISLIDDQGNTRGWGNLIEVVAPLPYSEWQEGMVVRTDFALVIFPDTPPGEYHLSAWIDRPATGETVGVFPLDEEEPFRVGPR